LFDCSSISSNKTSSSDKRSLCFLNSAPFNDDYNNKLGEQVDALVQAIPLQNRTALTRYVARRKLVLELFEKIIDEQLAIHCKYLLINC
jgi:hypothetical protein